MNKHLTVASYDGLLRRVRKVLIEGRQRIEQERVRTYWETGRIIHTDILKHKDRAEYGDEIIRKLSQDLGVENSTLHRCVRFAQMYPKSPIVGGRPQFTWTHYRKLIAIHDDRKRLILEEMASRNDWSADELAARIKDERAVLSPARPRPAAGNKPLTPLCGTLHTYQIVKRPSVNAGAVPELRVDLGFGVFHKADSRLLSGLGEGDIVESRPKEDAYRFVKADRTAKDLYTYAASVEKVIDGDTLKVRLDLGFNTEIRQTLRLRGIDCPEMDTREGQAAKAFVQSYLKQAQTVTVRSSRSDKYDRYLADVFIPSASGDIFLNNLLLDHAHAVRMKD